MRPEIVVTAEQFVEGFKQAYPTGIPPKIVGDAKSRTKFMLDIVAKAAKYIRLDDFGNSIKLQVQREDKRLDQTWFYCYDARKGRVLPGDPIKEGTSLEEIAYRILVGIQHESTPSKILRLRLYDLLHFNIPLKVLISYPYKEEAPRRIYTISYSYKMANKILTRDATDPRQNQYLLCFGPDGADWSITQWSFFCFDPDNEKFHKI